MQLYWVQIIKVKRYNDKLHEVCGSVWLENKLHEVCGSVWLENKLHEVCRSVWLENTH